VSAGSGQAVVDIAKCSYGCILLPLLHGSRCGALMKGLLVAGVCLIALASRAHADDRSGLILVKAPVAPVPYYDWTGFYVGGHVAYSLGRVNSTLFDPDPTASSNSFGSLYGGLQAGYNYVLPSRLLLGIEADITFPYFFENGAMFSTGTALGTTVTDQIDYIATLRGRFGYAFDHWLVYGTGGFAWSQARLTETPGVTNDPADAHGLGARPRRRACDCTELVGAVRIPL